MADQLPLRFGTAGEPRPSDLVIHAGIADAASAVDRWPSWPGGVLCLVGPAGSGKSHLARRWAFRVGADMMDGVDRRLPEGPSLLEDADRRPADERLFHLINRAAEPGFGLLLTARTSPATWPTDVADLRSRLNALPVTQLDEPDDAGLEALLERGFRARHVRPSPGLLTYLVRRVERSARAAMEVAARLDEAALAASKPVSRSFARELLGDQADLFPDTEGDEGPLSHA